MTLAPEPAAEFISLQHAAIRYDLSVDYLRDRIAAGALPAVRLAPKRPGGRQLIRVRVADVDALLTPHAAAPRPRRRNTR